MTPEWQGLSRDFAAWMKYRNLSANTQRIYTGAVETFARFVADTGLAAGQRR